MPKVSNQIQPDVLERFSDLNFKPSQAIAEFIDNAIQSYLDNKNNYGFYHNGYKLIVDVKIEWGDTENGKTFAKAIEIRDNAAGINKSKFEHAFETGHRPDFNEGLNEYGMGMKVAAFWLCRRWTTISKCFSESVERILVQDLDEIIPNRLQSLDYSENNVYTSGSYTVVRLDNLYKKNNFTKARLGLIKAELASIYRGFLRRNEIQINVDNESLSFEEPKILNAPYYDNPEGKPFVWTVSVNTSLFGKELLGSISLLDEMSEKHSGLVVMRRGRVIVGESSDHLYHPAVIFGSYKNGFRYKRIYGEIEIKGFDASFNKNGFSNMEELESMLEAIKDVLYVQGYSLLKQAENYRARPSATECKICWDFDNETPALIETYKTGDTIKLPSEPQKDGYIFAGWSPRPALKAKGDATYTANWKSEGNGFPPAPPKEFTVIWQFDNGEDTKSEIYKENQKIQLPDIPKKEGYFFDGWAPAPPLFANSNYVFTAVWKEISANTTDIVDYKDFLFKGKNYRINLLVDGEIPVLFQLDMTDFATKNIILCKLNKSLLPTSEDSINDKNIRTIIMSLAIGMFKSQMLGKDNSDNIIKFMSQK